MVFLRALFPLAILCLSHSILTTAFVCRETLSFHNLDANTRLQYSTNDDIPPLTKFLDKLANTNLLTTEKSVKQNALVVAKYDLPNLGIYADQMYELQSVYLQGKKSTLSSGGEGIGNSGGIIEKVPLPSLELDNRQVPSGYTLYITLYSPLYHDSAYHGGRGVIVTPEEVGLVRMKDEIADSILVALPVLSIWVGTSMTFVNIYQQKYGGNFLDAFLGT